MTSGLSIMNPTSEELEKQGLILRLDSDERPLWLGTPNIKYSFFLVSPTTLLFSLIFAAYLSVKFGLVYNSDRNVHGAIIYGCLSAFIFACDLIIILSLKPFFYLITDKNLHIVVKDTWYLNLLYYTRKASDGLLKYPLVYMRDFEVRKSALNKKVGNIYLENSILSDGTTYNHKMVTDVIFRVKRFPIQLSTKIGYADVLYCVNDVLAVCELLREAILKARISKANGRDKS